MPSTHPDLGDRADKERLTKSTHPDSVPDSLEESVVQIEPVSDDGGIPRGFCCRSGDFEL